MPSTVRTANLPSTIRKSTRQAIPSTVSPVARFFVHLNSCLLLTLSPNWLVWNMLRNAIPRKENRHFVSVNGGQCIQPVDARNNIAGFKLVQPACWQLKFRIAELPGERNARLMNVTQGQTQHQA